jgi:hypothetical protein
MVGAFSFARSARVGAIAILCGGLVLIRPQRALCQANSATLYGTVTDPSGAVSRTQL